MISGHYMKKRYDSLDEFCEAILCLVTEIAHGDYPHCEIRLLRENVTAWGYYDYDFDELRENLVNKIYNKAIKKTEIEDEDVREILKVSLKII